MSDIDPAIASVLDKLRSEYDAAIEARRRAEARIAQLHSAITALEAASTDEPLRFEGSLADACRNVLMASKTALAPIEVRDGVVALGFDLSTLSHSNHMASIHSVLKRLVESGDVKPVEIGTTVLGRTTKYQWTGHATALRVASNVRSLADLFERQAAARESVAAMIEKFVAEGRFAESEKKKK